MFIKKAVRQ